jgi:aspartate--ammonia ligase
MGLPPWFVNGYETSSMGIRVDPETLVRQLKIRGLARGLEFPSHRMLVAGEVPQSIGGWIGQSRTCMFFMRTVYVGDASVGIWPAAMQATCAQAGIPLL